MPAAVRMSRAALRNIHENHFLGTFFISDRHSARSGNLDSYLRVEIKSDVRGSGNESVKRMCCKQRPEAEFV